MKVQARTTIEEEITGTITATDLLASLRATFKLPAGAFVHFYVQTGTSSGAIDIDEDMPVQFKATWRREATPPPATPPEAPPGITASFDDIAADVARRSRLRSAVDESLLRARDQHEPVAPDRHR